MGRSYLQSAGWAKRKYLLYIEFWGYTLACGLILLLRLVPDDFHSCSPLVLYLQWGLFLIRTFTFHLWLPLIAILVLACYKRKWTLAGVTVLVMVAGASQVLEDYLPKSRPQVEYQQTRTIKCMSFNLLYCNYQHQAVLQEILATDADLLLLQEYTPLWHRHLAPVLSPRYPFYRGVLRDDCFGLAVYTRLKLATKAGWRCQLAGVVPQMRLELIVAGQRVVIYNIHLLPPYRIRYVKIWRAQIQALLERLAQEKLPLILCGDFNFTEQSRAHQALLALGLQETHQTCAWGRGSTWSHRSLWQYCPGIRLDHIYYRGWYAWEHHIGAASGSDHAPVSARLQLQLKRPPKGFD